MPTSHGVGVCISDVNTIEPFGPWTACIRCRLSHTAYAIADNQLRRKQNLPVGDLVFMLNTGGGGAGDCLKSCGNCDLKARGRNLHTGYEGSMFVISKGCTITVTPENIN